MDKPKTFNHDNGDRPMKFNGIILKQIRQKKGVSQQELCNAIKFSQALLSKYERCLVKKPPVHRIKQISDHLDVPYESFFTEDANEELTANLNQTSNTSERIDVYVHVKIDWGFKKKENDQ